MSEPRTAAVPRGAKSKLRPRPAHEFICIVGGCSNTFNGWFFLAEKARDDSSASFFGAVPPRNLREIKYYVDFPHTQSKTLAEALELKKNPRGRVLNLTGIPADKRQENGLSDETVQKFIDKGWDKADIWAWPTATHDLYWGNFVDPAARLFAEGPEWDPPLERPVPKPGDVVTFLVFWPAYQKRMKTDWAASPHNQNHWKKLEAMDIWHTEWMHVMEKPSGSAGPPSHQELERKIEALKAREAYATKALSEEDINFYIMMRTTGKNEEGYQKRPADFDSYLRYVYERLLGSVKHKGVMPKILLCNTAQQMVDYISKGAWSGDLWDDYSPYVEWDNPSPKQAEARARRKNQNYAFEPPREYHKVHGRWRYPSWAKAPSIDRKVVKIFRLDYIGHSDGERMMLEYGWNNKKGELPDIGEKLTRTELDACQFKQTLAPDARAMLWGCSLGATVKQSDGSMSGIGPYLAEKYFGGGVVAADTRTTFDFITDRDTNMPIPIKDKPWILYNHR